MSRSIIETQGKVEAKKDLKRQRILDAAKRRFGRSGIRAATMQDIAQDAGVAVGTIYQFFPDKDALVLAWVEEHRQLIADQLQEVLSRSITADEKLREFLKVRFHTVRSIREEPAIAEITRAVLRLAPHTVSEMSALVLSYLRRILTEGLKSGRLPSVKPTPDSEVLFLALTGFYPAAEDPILGPPQETSMLRVVDWFIAKWKQPRP